MTFSRIVGGPLQIPPKRLNPNDIRIAGSRVCKLWSETCPAIGTTTTTSASVGDVSTWGTIRCTRTPGFPDPDGGNGAVKITENVSGNDSHYIHGPLVNGGGIWLDYSLWITSLPGGRDWHLLFAPGAEVGIWFNATTGVVGENYPLGGTAVTATVTPDGGGFWVTLKVRGGTGIATQIRVYPANGDGTFTYAGDGRDTSLVYRATVTQIRASAQNNLARADDNSLIDATGGVQTTIANQPLILDQNGNFYTGSSGQIPVVTREAGRVSNLVYTDPDVLAVANGDDPAFAVAGICKLSGAGAAPLAWYGSGSAADVPFRINGTNLESHRHDGTTGSTKTLGTNLAASVGSWTSFAFLRHADRSCQLYLAGALVATITHDDLASLTATSLQTGPVTVTTPVQYSLARMAWAGDLTYDAIRPALLAACARYPGLGLVA